MGFEIQRSAAAFVREGYPSNLKGGDTASSSKNNAPKTHVEATSPRINPWIVVQAGLGGLYKKGMWWAELTWLLTAFQTPIAAPVSLYSRQNYGTFIAPL